MRILIFIFAILSAYQGVASTFVGNGGNAGDIELQMTLGQAQQSLEFVDRDKDLEDQNLCTCSQSFEGRPVCDVLKNLNQEQVRFCSKFMRLKAADLSRLLGQKDQLSFSWTHEQIEVQEGRQRRSADAVTDPKNMSMVLNQKRFLEMDESERVFLVSHELFHLTSYQGAFLSDEGNIGPFKGMDGGRQLINAMAATVVLQAHKYGVFRGYQAAERRSKSYKKNWLSAGYQSVTTENDPSTALDIEKTTGGHFGYRYQWTQEVGFITQFTSLKGSKGILTTAEALEQKNILSLGAAYRWFPFSNPLTGLGQSHFLLGATLDLLNAQYEIHDPSVGTTAKTSSTGYTLLCNYFIPFSSGLWAYAGLAYSSLHYSFNLDNQLNLNYKNDGTAFALGVSYGF